MFLQYVLKPFSYKSSSLVRNMASASGSKLSGKIAIVTASTDGIGYSIARRLAQDGAKVIISSRKQKNVDSAVTKLKAEKLDVTGLVCHVSNSEDRKKLFTEAAKLGGLDILVSNAGTNPTMGYVLDCEESSWDKIFEVNVKAAYLLAKEALPLLRKSSSGRIVFVSSIAGLQPFELLGAYSVSKTALLGLTKTAAQQLAGENITVNCVAPGIIQTKFASALVDSPDNKEHVLARIPMRRLGKSDEIGNVVSFLVSEDASYITGETIVAAGGMQSRL